MKKLVALFLFISALIGLLASCSTPDPSPVGEYIYEGEGFGGDFTISVYEDGTFSYCVGLLASYLGHGEWTLDGDVLRLKDNVSPSLNYDNYFEVKDGKLVFIGEGSTNFMYLKVADGAVFNKAPSEQ